MATPTYLLEEKEIVHQINIVLRLRLGDFVCFFDGKTQKDYVYKLKKQDKKSITFQFKEVIFKENSTQNIHLYQAIPNKLVKLEYIVQKCSEIGIKSITFFQGTYSQESKFLTEKKVQRLKKIAIESAEQSNRNSIIQLTFEKKLNFSSIQTGNLICFHTEKNKTIPLRDIVLKKELKTSLFVGPEGGFHPSEIENFKQIKTQFVHLGTNILRTETTGLVSGFYIIQHFYN